MPGANWLQSADSGGCEKVERTMPNVGLMYGSAGCESADSAYKPSEFHGRIEFL